MTGKDCYDKFPEPGYAAHVSDEDKKSYKGENKGIIDTGSSFLS